MNNNLHNELKSAKEEIEEGYFLLFEDLIVGRDLEEDTDFFNDNNIRATNIGVDGIFPKQTNWSDWDYYYDEDENLKDGRIVLGEIPDVDIPGVVDEGILLESRAVFPESTLETVWAIDSSTKAVTECAVKKIDDTDTASGFSNYVFVSKTPAETEEIMPLTNSLFSTTEPVEGEGGTLTITPYWPAATLATGSTTTMHFTSLGGAFEGYIKDKDVEVTEKHYKYSKKIKRMFKGFDFCGEHFSIRDFNGIPLSLTKYKEKINTLTKKYSDAIDYTFAFNSNVTGVAFRAATSAPTQFYIKKVDSNGEIDLNLSDVTNTTHLFMYPLKGDLTTLNEGSLYDGSAVLNAGYGFPSGYGCNIQLNLGSRTGLTVTTNEIAKTITTVSGRLYSLIDIKPALLNLTKYDTEAIAAFNGTKIYR